MGALMLLLALATGAQATVAQGPCLAIHYGREGYRHETSMQSVESARICPTGAECIRGFAPRGDVQDFIAVRYADRWRIAQNWRALVQFRLHNGSWSYPVWLQPVDYQAPWDVRSSACRVETSEKLARSMGWSFWQGWGATTAYILRWER